MSPIAVLDPDSLARDLSLRDLTDPAAGPHALQLLIRDVTATLRAAWRCDLLVQRSAPVVRVEDNYDDLGYTPGAVTRDARYTRYVSPAYVLRTHTSASIPPLLRGLAAAPPRDLLLACPGIVYRRDAIDRLHTGTPHQLDLWRIGQRPLGPDDLDEMVGLVTGALLPGARVRTEPAVHPYTEHGRQIDVDAGDGWVEIGECGVAAPRVLARADLHPARVGGLAMGIGLDRVLMLRKGVPDIRMLRSDDPRVTDQMADLDPWRPVSNRPAVRRDLSVAVAADETAESVGDRVRAALGDDALDVEAVEVVSETPVDALPAGAVARLGIAAGQKNVLLRLVLRGLDRTLTDAEANVLRDRVYAALHEGARHEWATPAAQPAP